MSQRNSGDLLRIGWIDGLARSSYYPLTIQLFVLIVFGYLLYDGFFGVQGFRIMFPISFEPLGDNFALIGPYFIFWHLVIVLTMVLFGRIWCSWCPLGAVNGFFARFGKQKEFPKKIGHLGLPLLIYLLVLLYMYPFPPLLGSPYNTAVLFAIGFIIAMVMGNYFKGRSFCHHICPLAGCLTVWGMAAPLELTAARDICDKCTTHDCLRGNERVEGCPMGLFPGYMDGMRNCILCMKCVKACPYGSLQLRWRAPSVELGRVQQPLFWEALTTLVLVDIFTLFVAYWIPHGGFYERISASVADSLHAVLASVTSLSQTGHMGRFLVFFAVILGLYLIATLLCGKVLRLNFRRAFSAFSYPYVNFSIWTCVGYMVFRVILGSGYVLDRVLIRIGVYSHYEAGLYARQLVDSVGPPLFMWPILAITPYTLYLIYRVARNSTQSSKMALLGSLPHFGLIIYIILLYTFKFQLRFAL